MSGPVVQVRVGVEVGPTSISLVLFASENGGPESRVSIPIHADDARGLADSLFDAARRVDLPGHEAMLNRISECLRADLLLRAAAVGDVH